MFKDVFSVIFTCFPFFLDMNEHLIISLSVMSFEINSLCPTCDICRTFCCGLSPTLMAMVAAGLDSVAKQVIEREMPSVNVMMSPF